MSPATACEDVFPFFLLYNGGALNGFGFVVNAGDLDGTYYEHPANSVVPVSTIFRVQIFSVFLSFFRTSWAALNLTVSSRDPMALPN